MEGSVMSSPIEVKITGLDEIQKKLQDELPRKAANAMRAALRDGAKILQSAIVQEAPKDSGLLSEHIDVRTRVRGGGLSGSAFVGPNSKVTYPTSDKPRPGKGPRAKPAWLVAKFLEFGTVRMGANPFMTRAFMSNQQKAIDAVIARLREIFGL
jgi:HK97 gp10 family phage protein